MQTTILIGNGPSATTRELGAQIDRFQRVVRFNNYVTAGHEQQLGSKTDVWVNCFYHVTWRDPAQFQEIFLPRNAHGVWEKSWQNLLGVRDQVLIARTSHHTIDWLAARGVRHASAGMVAIAYYLEQGENVSLHGFDHFAPGQPHHYFGGTRPRGCPHDGRAERKLISDLIARGRVERV